MRLAAAMPSLEMTLTIYHSELVERERKILSITGDPLDYRNFSWLKDENKKEEVQSLLSERYRILSEMFELHCSDSEAKRFESQNDNCERSAPTGETGGHGGDDLQSLLGCLQGLESDDER